MIFHVTLGSCLGDKGETPEIFKTFARRAQREYNSPIVKIRSDNGTEFKNMKIEEWCDEEGIKQFIHVLDPRDHNLALPYLALYLIVSFLACVGCLVSRLVN